MGVEGGWHRRERGADVLHELGLESLEQLGLVGAAVEFTEMMPATCSVEAASFPVEHSVLLRRSFDKIYAVPKFLTIKLHIQSVVQSEEPRFLQHQSPHL